MSLVRRPRAAPVVVAAVAVCCLAVAGCSGTASSGPSRTTAPSEAVDSGTPLGDLDTTALVVARAPFCGRVDPAAVTRALGGDAGDVSSYRSGQRIKISDGVADVVHEFGCRWHAGDATAEAWVFAPPVTRDRAAGLVREVRGEEGCAGGPAFGRPSVTCRSQAAGRVTFTARGLFGDAWLSCRLILDAADQEATQDRASRWCAAVAAGAAS